MTNVQLIQLSISPEQQETSKNAVLEKANSILQSSKLPLHAFTVGTLRGDSSTLQMMLQLTSPHDSMPQLRVDLDKLTPNNPIPTPTKSATFTFSTSPFASPGPANAPLVEFVQSVFPASSAADPAFRRKIEQDFQRFTQLYETEAKDHVGCVWGWGDALPVSTKAAEGKSEGEARDEAKTTTAFLVVRGWHNYEDFESSMSTEAFAEAKKIVFAWGMPHKMWFVERPMDPVSMGHLN